MQQDLKLSRVPGAADICQVILPKKNLCPSVSLTSYCQCKSVLQGHHIPFHKATSEVYAALNALQNLQMWVQGCQALSTTWTQVRLAGHMQPKL